MNKVRVVCYCKRLQLFFVWVFEIRILWGGQNRNERLSFLLIISDFTLNNPIANIFKRKQMQALAISHLLKLLSPTCGGTGTAGHPLTRET